MQNDWFPVQRSILAGTALADRILAHYDLPQPVTCQLYSNYANSIYRVQAGDERFWLRIYNYGEFSYQEIEAEVAVLNQLAAYDIPATRVVQSRTGQFIYTLQAPEGERYCVLTTHAPGRAPRREITSDQAAAYGSAVGRLHQSLDQLPQRYERPQLDLNNLLDEPLAYLQPVLAHRPEDWRFLTQAASWLRIHLSNLPTANPIYGLCHGDLHKANVLFELTGGLTLIDWDCLGYGWRAYDLAVLRWSIGPAVGAEGIGEPRLSQVWESYRCGYQDHRPLTTAETAALPLFVAVRQIRVLGWDVQRALDGRLGVWLLNDEHFDHHLGLLRQWLKEQCGFNTESGGR